MTDLNLASAYQLLHDGSLALSRAEQHGIRVDVDLCTKEIERLDRKIKQCHRKFVRSDLVKEWKKVFRSKTNFNSLSQLSTVLYDVYKIKPTKTTVSGKGSTDEDTLKQVDVDELKYLLKIRKLQKIKDTYLHAYLREQVNGIIHPSFPLSTVSTYRSSSQNPNFQNIPNRDKEAMRICRSVLFPRKGHRLIEADFSGLEVAIAACYHKDPEMIRYLNDPNSDMHADQAYILFKLSPFANLLKKTGGMKFVPEFWTLRQASKNGFVFPEFYGDYYKNCAVGLACNWGGLPAGKWKANQGIPLPDGTTLGGHLIGQGIKSLDAFTKHVKEAEDDFWNRRFKVYNRWRKRWFSDYQDRGYFDMTTGFRCQGVMRRNEAINYPVQGAAFHCLLWTLIEVDSIMRKEQWRTRIIGEVHDSMMLDTHPDEFDYVIQTIQRVACKDLCKKWRWIIVPLSIEVEAGEVDESWADIKPVLN